MKTLDTLKLDQNICRIVPLENDQFLTASYHFEKEIDAKFGQLVAVGVDTEGNGGKISIKHKSEKLNYGILSLQR